MSEVTDTQANEEQDERELLKQRADDMGLTYAKNIPLDKLRKMVNDKLNGTSDEDGDSASKKAGKKPSQDEKLKEATKLVRIRVSNMNPNKRSHSGEIFTAGNSTIGTHKKYVPFDTEWHVPNIILKMIQRRKVQIFSRRKVNGKELTTGKLVPEFAVEVLPPLSEAELKQLALEQARRSGNSNE